MADSVYMHGLDEGDYLDLIPNDGVGQITEDSDGLNLRIIRTQLTRGAGIVNGLLVRNGIDPTALDANDQRTAQDAVLSYAQWRIAERISTDEQQIDRLMRAWNAARKDVRNMPGDYSENYEGVRASSNINTSDPSKTGIASLTDVTEYL